MLYTKGVTLDIYKNENKKQLLKISNLMPRVLNIANGSSADKELHAINIDLAYIGNPELVCNANNLSSFPDSYFTIIRTSHILEHFKPEEIENTIVEWTRVLHKNGELHIAVPTARIALNKLESEYVTGHTNPSVDFFHATTTLNQLCSVGCEDERTDPIWKQNIIFNYELLCWYLKKIGMEVIETISTKNTFAEPSKAKEVSSYNYSLIVRARKTQTPHTTHTSITDDEYADILKNFAYSNSQKERPPLSIIIPVRNEEATIKTFLENLLKSDICINDIFKIEYIVVCNGTTDRSVEIINEFIRHSPNLNLKIIYSETGILQAFHTGICARSTDGFVAKLDADCIIQKFTIPLMYINLLNNKDIQVTYAEPMPIGIENEFNYLQYHQWLRSQRLYIHGRCSMYRTNPFDLFNFDMIKKSGCRVEDIILSYCYAFYFGLDSIKCTDHAVIYSTPINNEHDFEKKILRINQEIHLIETSFPSFIPMRSILDRKLLREKQNLEYKNIDSLLRLYENLKNSPVGQASDHEWHRLESTKKLALTTAY
jgi:predicted SAM-dependent methyltransferase/glycosyltransferase involved in cell wall biosynthesis